MTDQKFGVIVHFNDGSVEDHTIKPDGDTAADVLRTVETFMTEYDGEDIYKLVVLVDN